MNQIIVNNLLISYYHYPGQQGGQCLLFLHGWRSSAQIWESIINNLESKHGIYAIDLPGFGRSQVPQKTITVGDYVDAIVEFIQKLKLKDVILIGHSFGGRISIKLAAKHPNLINKLILVDSAGFVMSSIRKTFMQVLAKIAKPIFKPAFMQVLRRKIYQKIGAEDYLATPELQKTFVNVVNEDLTEDMKKIEVPTLIIWGENDQTTPLKYVYKMKSLIPKAKYFVLKNAGHFSFLDKPEEFVSRLLNFING